MFEPTTTFLCDIYLLNHVSLIALGVLLLLLFGMSRKSKNIKGTSLNGPISPSFLFGYYRQLTESEDDAAMYEEWAKAYGPAYVVPGGFGTKNIVICDPRANAHFYSKETFGYVQTKLARIFIENLMGRGLLWSEGESHRRQRKALSPAFSNAAIRRLTPVFYDAAYKMTGAWNNAINAGSGQAIIDVQIWMNRISLDSIGIAGFGHDFHALDGQESAIVQVLESFSDEDTSILSRLVFFLGPVLPILQKLPTEQNRTVVKMKKTMRVIADELLERNRKAKDGQAMAEEKSIIGLLIKAESTSSSLAMSQEEILAQNVLLLAGYETTSSKADWALIELCRQPDKQRKLREELAQFTTSDPTFDQLSATLPYLDAVVQEVLRLHSPVTQNTRVAAEDDVIPFTNPVTTATGETITRLVIPKGASVLSPISYMNRAETYWGSNAREFQPERWLEKDACKCAEEIQGYKHILTFSDGPRICLGKSFALTEFKAVLSVMIRRYSFELPDGPDTKITKHPSILPRPKLSTVSGPKLYLKVKAV
ncbi:cytochrome P450 [Crepidotus variabilis]|uniref:Cytochrome P450 n=1 Tax=Crepidotus variabilis TaxID=179855 RepID=A0A9P6EJK2_9AGAR|nr:cytochrome P450 [Crepidotus variabilis]